MLKIFKAIAVFVLLVGLVPAASCSKPASNSTSESNATSTKPYAVLVQTSKELGWKGTLSFSPDPALSSKSTTFTLNLVDQAGQPLTGAVVNFVLFMPLMDMGKTEFSAASRGPGSYAGDGAFFMKGIWILQTNVERSGQHAQLEFEIHVEVP